MAASTEGTNEFNEVRSDAPSGVADGPQTALAPVWARVVAFVAIIAGGLAGALVGGRFGDVGGRLGAHRAAAPAGRPMLADTATSGSVDASAGVPSSWLL